MATDFSYKQSPAFSHVLDLVANQRVKEQQIRESQQNVEASKVNVIRGVANDAASMVSGMVTAAREKQKQSALKDLTSMFSTAGTPTPGTLPEGVAGPQPKYTTVGQTPDFQNKARSLLIQANPEAATKQMAENLFPRPATASGTPPRSFESYLISQVNAGLMTKEQAAEELAQYKPNYSVLGTDGSMNPLVLNTHAATPSVKTIPGKGPIYDKTIKEPSTTDAAQISGAVQNLESLGDVKKRLFPNGKIDRELLAEMRFPGGGAPFSEGREIYSKMIESIQAIQYMESGKAVTEAEAAKLLDRYLPKNRDNDQTATNKINRLFDRQKNTLDTVDPRGIYRARIKKEKHLSDPMGLFE